MSNKFFVATLLVLFLFLPLVNAVTLLLQVASSTSPSTITPGNDGYVELTITNVGTTAIDSIKVKSLKLDQPLSLKTTAYLENLGSLGTSKAVSAIYKFNVPLATASGFYIMEFLVEACTSNTCNSYVQTALIKVQAPTSLEIINVNPDSIMAGESTILIFTLKNSGETAINNIKFSWDDPADVILPLGSDNKKFISTINGKGEVQTPVKIVVSPDANPGIYPLLISMEYDDQTGTKQSINSTVGLKVIGDFNFIVSLESQSLVAPGMSGSVDVKVANAGTQEAQFLTLNFLESDSITKITPSVIYIGNIESDDYDTETISFSVANVQPGEYPIMLEVSYKDLYGNVYSDKYELDIVVSSKEAVSAQQSDSSWLFYLVILFIVGYLLYRKFRKKKR